MTPGKQPRNPKVSGIGNMCLNKQLRQMYSAVINSKGECYYIVDNVPTSIANFERTFPLHLETLSRENLDGTKIK